VRSAATYDSDSQTGAGVGDTVLGPPWPGIAQHKSDSTGALTLVGGSEYLSVGQMTGERGNTLTVYMDRWGGSAGNYILAPEMVLSWPENWGEGATGITRHSFPEQDGGLVPNTPGTLFPVCLINCDGGTHTSLESVPEPATIWLVGLCVVALLLSKRIQKVSGWIHRQKLDQL
jgi:PEP-CTERM motif